MHSSRRVSWRLCCLSLLGLLVLLAPGAASPRGAAGHKAQVAPGIQPGALTLQQANAQQALVNRLLQQLLAAASRQQAGLNPLSSQNAVRSGSRTGQHLTTTAGNNKTVVGRHGTATGGLTASGPGSQLTFGNLGALQTNPNRRTAKNRSTGPLATTTKNTGQNNLASQLAALLNPGQTGKRTRTTPTAGLNNTSSLNNQLAALLGGSQPTARGKTGTSTTGKGNHSSSLTKQLAALSQGNTPRSRGTSSALTGLLGQGQHHGKKAATNTAANNPTLVLNDTLFGGLNPLFPTPIGMYVGMPVGFGGIYPLGGHGMTGVLTMQIQELVGLP